MNNAYSSDIEAPFFDGNLAQNNRAKLHHTLQYSSDNKAAMNTGGL